MLIFGNINSDTTHVLDCNMAVARKYLYGNLTDYNKATVPIIMQITRKNKTRYIGNHEYD